MKKQVFISYLFICQWRQPCWITVLIQNNLCLFVWICLHLFSTLENIWRKEMTALVYIWKSIWKGTHLRSNYTWRTRRSSFALEPLLVTEKNKQNCQQLMLQRWWKYIHIYIFNIYISTVYSQSLLSVQDVQEVRLYLKVPGIEPQTHGIRATPHHTVHKHPEQLVALYLQEDPLVQGSLLVLEVLADPEKEEQFWSMTRCVESGRSNWQDSSSGDGYIPSHRGVLVGHHFLSYPRSTKKKRKWTEMLKRCNWRKTYILYQPVNRFHRWVKLHRS